MKELSIGDFKIKVYTNDKLPPDSFLIISGDEAVAFTNGEIRGPIKVTKDCLRRFEEYTVEQLMERGP